MRVRGREGEREGGRVVEKERGMDDTTVTDWVLLT